jgi:hypothetical protein
VYCFKATPGNSLGGPRDGIDTLMVVLPMCFSVDIALLIAILLVGAVGMMPLPFGGPSLLGR